MNVENVKCQNLQKKLEKYIRLGYSIHRIAAVIVRCNPDFDVSTLINKGYLTEFPYDSTLLWKIRRKWYTIAERNIEKKFLLLLEEVQHEL